MTIQSTRKFVSARNLLLGAALLAAAIGFMNPHESHAQQATPAPASAQTGPQFEIADIHVVPYRNLATRGDSVRGGRYELRGASMLDLIRIAYSVDATAVFGGPNWLDWDHFDVIAKVPSNARPEAVKAMLRSLLADRFKLAVHKDTRPLPAFVLSTGKGKSKLKQAADASAATGCQAAPAAEPGIFPPLSCRNMTMQALAQILQERAPDYLSSPIVDATNLKGVWDFEIEWTPQGALSRTGADRITLFDAIEKQLGLNLKLQEFPMPAVVVDRVNQKPTANLPGVTTRLILPPPEFEVASIRPSPLDDVPPGSIDILPGGTMTIHRQPLFNLIDFALEGFGQPIAGTPASINLKLGPNAPHFDIVAKAPANTMTGPTQVDVEDFRAMARALLVDRFKMVTHYEDRPVDTYTLAAGKPKLRKTSDPASRTGCKTARTPSGDPETKQYVCRNMTMAQFAEWLRELAPNNRYPLLDSTGIRGAWDFTLTFSRLVTITGGNCAATKQGCSPPGAGQALDPIAGLSLFDALEKQLGLKLEKHKRPERVVVIDRIEDHPTEN